MVFLTSRFVRGKLWAEELLDCILWYSAATFFVDRVWKIPGSITFEWLKGLQNRLQKSGASLDSNAPLDIEVLLFYSWPCPRCVWT